MKERKEQRLEQTDSRVLAHRLLVTTAFIELLHLFIKGRIHMK